MSASKVPSIDGPDTRASADELRAELLRLNKRLHQSYRQMDEGLSLAQRIQQSLLPKSLPQVPGVQVAVYHQPGSGVGAELHDFFRLDEHRVGFYVAEVMEHGLPGCLLSIFLHFSMHKKLSSFGTCCSVPPREMLEHLNRELLAQQLSETPLVSMVFGVINHENRVFTFARAGHPCPLYLPHDGEIRQWRLEGSFLGVVEGDYAEQSEQLHDCDKVLLFRNGVVTSASESDAGVSRLFALAKAARTRRVREFVHEVGQEAFSPSPAEGITLLGFEMLGGRSERET